MVVDLDRVAFDDRFGEFEVRHIWASPRSVNGEEAEHRNRQVVKMCIGVCHHLGGFFGGSIKRHLRVDFVILGVRHLGVCTINT